MSILINNCQAAKSTNIEILKSNILQEFNSRIIDWYENAKTDHGITGKGVAKFEGDLFLVYYEENGNRFLAKMAICDEYLIDNKIEWLFNVWSELAMEIIELDPHESTHVLR
jgi:hypothetical protein